MPLGAYGAAGLAGLGGLGPGLDLDVLGAGRSSGGGAKRPLLLAQHQGNYAGAHGAYSAGAGRSLLAAQFMSEALRQQLQQYNYLVQSQWVPGADEPALPEVVGPYHTLYPLEDLAAAEEHPSAALGVRTAVIKGISGHDGQPTALRRVDGKQVLPSGELLSNARQAVEQWSAVSGHPGLVCPRDVFVTADLDGSPSLVMTHPYHPGAATLAQAHLMPTQTASGQLVRNSPNENVLWSYAIQLSAALRAVHAAGLAVRPACLSPSKVLVLPLGRLRIGSLGVVEALGGDVALGGEELLQAQRDDVMAMGQLLLTLACSAGGVAVPNLDFAAAHFSPDFVRMLALLLGTGEGGAFSWRHMAALTGERMMAEVDALAGFNDHLVSDLAKEMENGRLLRLLIKLGFINERPEGDVMNHWSETGDRYLLKLFRDFVFHQADAEGAPRLDWGHVVEALNKLDAGVQEQVLLLSRDEQSMLVASYADIKRCIETSFAELRAAGTRTGSR
ncbi:MAG: hypothetical protein J3K34DRAFT_377450 [Monoraphidium minutum]|nr:MAG: hypothetical protein J3K34DRAFT_377450 [Monoraphidium minutum]